MHARPLLSILAGRSFFSSQRINQKLAKGSEVEHLCSPSYLHVTSLVSARRDPFFR